MEFFKFIFGLCPPNLLLRPAGLIVTAKLRVVLLTGSSLAAGQFGHSPLDTHKDRSECGPLIPMLIMPASQKSTL